MLEKTKVTKVKKALTPDKLERFKTSEAGFIGLPLFNGVSNAEQKRELNFPNSINIYKQMSYHSVVNSFITLVDNIISKATWKVNPPKDATEDEKNKCSLVHSMLHDMEGSWGEFISDVLSINQYGFALHEKVYRRRLKSNGSDFDDGIWGWRKLPIRAQESIEKFIFSENGNEVIGVRQNVSALSDPYGRYSNLGSLQKNLPMSKVLLFRAGKHRGDPYGCSPLRDAYLAWRFLTTLEDLEAVGVSKDLNGVPLLKIPADYLQPASSASPEQLAARAYYENSLRNMNMNQQTSILLPSDVNPETKTPLFDLQLISAAGNKSFDLNKIKEYYKNMMLTSLFSDVLMMGQSTVGSFALGSIKNSLSASFAHATLKRICDVLNKDLIKQTYEINGWDVSRRGTLDFDNLDPIDLDTLSKAIQRIGAVGFLPKNHEVVNRALASIGVDELAEDADLDELLGDNVSRSGDGMAQGMGNGTSSSVATGDNSSLNTENA